MVGVDYRFVKSFSGEYRDENGVSSNRTYKMYVRYLDGDKATVDNPKQSEWLIKSGAIQEKKLGDITIGYSDFDHAYHVIEKELKDYKGRHLVSFANGGASND